MINSSNKTLEVPWVNVYHRFIEEEGLKVKKSKLPIKKLDEKVNNVECWG